MQAILMPDGQIIMMVPLEVVQHRSIIDIPGPGILSNYAEMNAAYSALSEDKKADQYVFLQVGKVIVCDQTAQMIDLWGDIPYFQANSINSNRNIVNAPFDAAATIYDTLISNLKDLNTYFAAASLSSNAQSALTAQDLIYKGKLSKWREYANSLRLRLLMRISNANESFAKTEVATMLQDPNTYPLLTDNADNAQLNQSPSTLESDIQGGIGLAPFAPDYLLDSIMAPNNDPRLAVYWDTVSGGKYVGFPITGTASDYTNAVNNHTISTFDSSTFIYNYNVPGILFNAAETNFLEAEAYERWGLGDASIPYYAGIQNSIDFYYGINASRILKSGSWPVLAEPSSTQISTYEALPSIAYSGSTEQKLAKIYTQKWEHFFILQAQQAWAEYRRTGYPQLKFYDNVSSDGENPPLRLLYPSAEALYNADNYSKVASQDKKTTKIFWDVN
ncbi:MAG: SusD/RagB family nutrient-binding outer membrane lipoprotein [Arachidicoccus sp.]|nr:SusD/RagB family nutrient-binding outer membrane lipoprotein [Arachidicoccus sp.]